METNKDYENIDRPYNVSLDRTADSQQLTGGQASGSTVNGNLESQPVKSDGGSGDVWIRNFIRSENWKPKNVGFYINGQTGYAEFSNVFISGDIRALTGTIGGFTIGATELTASASGNTTILSSGATAFSAGPTGSPLVTITQAGALNAASGIIGGTTITATALIGGTIQTAVDGSSRIVMTGNSIKGYTVNTNRTSMSNDTITLLDSSGNDTITLRSTFFRVGSATTQLDTQWYGAMTPMVTATYNSGAGGNRWNTIYCVTLDESSDSKLKKSVKKSSYGLKELLKLEPKEYDMYGKHKHGLMAQDLYKIMPEMTSGCEPGAPEGSAGISYLNLIPVLITAIKELSDRIKVLEKI